MCVCVCVCAGSTQIVDWSKIDAIVLFYQYTKIDNIIDDEKEDGIAKKDWPEEVS